MVVQHFQRNNLGRDLVVGDIHGCFDRLFMFLGTLGFNPKVDRLFSVGDLIDRGPDNEQVLEWLDRPWFFAVRGNHEEMAAAPDISKSIHLSNGGAWLYRLPEPQREAIKAVFRTLPIAIEIETARGLVGLVHAECPLADWAEFVRQLPDDTHLQDLAMWSRLRVKGRTLDPIANVSMVISGHSPLEAIKVVGNSHFIDTGAVFAGGYLSIMDITHDQLFSERRT